MPAMMAKRSKPRRVYHRMSDNELLDLLVSGELVVDLETAEVRKGTRVLTPSLVAGRDGSKRYRIEVYSEGGRRTIVRHKLVYMAGNLRLIPDGYEVHHCDLNPHNDVFSNLVLLTNEDHKKIHGKFDINNRFQQWDTPF